MVFVTVCTDNRKRILDRDDAHALILRAWRQADGWTVGRYTVMPDHIHLFCCPGTESPPTLAKWVRYWKSLCSMEWPRSDEQPVWEPSFWDRQLRSGQSYVEKWEYVRRNPVRAGLVADPDDWPHQGEIAQLEWHDECRR
jgi:putative transposase